MNVFGCVSGRLRCVFGASWSISERFGAVLEQFWRCLGDVLERLWSGIEARWSFFISFNRSEPVLQASWKRLVGVSGSLKVVLRPISHQFLF